MRLSSVGLGLGLALLASPVMAATADAGAGDARTHIMWFPSDRLWTEALPLQACAPGAIAPAGELALASPLRLAAFERRGELIAELRSSQALSLATLTTARRCASRAADAATTLALLTAAAETWPAFQGALASCLQAEGAAKSVGSLTLWVDTSCNW
ncbi:hypothetical protein [Phenylobacterium sp.]|uniref:hypothetical protein n=1 Tax=Phenylobacterium sp. TaxID=1871053 RepID=UPI002810B79C|nr:hypothetical protein [Phenylobacterium sp.]